MKKSGMAILALCLAAGVFGWERTAWGGEISTMSFGTTDICQVGALDCFGSACLASDPFGLVTCPPGSVLVSGTGEFHYIVGLCGGGVNPPCKTISQPPVFTTEEASCGVTGSGAILPSTQFPSNPLFASVRRGKTRVLCLQNGSPVELGVAETLFQTRVRAGEISGAATGQSELVSVSAQKCDGFGTVKLNKLIGSMNITESMIPVATFPICTEPVATTAFKE